MAKTKTYYVIRSGWNAANQSSMGTVKNPKNKFESNLYCLVGIVEATSAQDAINQFNATCYNNQTIFAETNPRAIKGLTAQISYFLKSSLQYPVNPA